MSIFEEGSYNQRPRPFRAAFGAAHQPLSTEPGTGHPVGAPITAPSVRSCKKIGWQADPEGTPPAPQKRKPLRTNVGQTLSSVNPAISAISFTASQRAGSFGHRISRSKTWQDSEKSMLATDVH